MRPVLGWRHATGAAFACVCASGFCAEADTSDVVPTGTCPSGISFESAGYMVRTARVEGPFASLPWLRRRFEQANQDVSELAGKPYRAGDVRGKTEILERLNFPDDSGNQRVRVLLVITSVENCSDKELDVVYSVYSSQIAPLLSGTPESRRSERSAPEKVAGADDTRNRLRVAPIAGYDQSQRLYGGGRVEFSLPPDGAHGAPFESFTLDGTASTAMHDVSASVSGSSVSDSNWLARADWQLNYASSLQPAHDKRLRTDRFAAQLSAITRPLGPWQLPLRFGGLLEGGRQESDTSGAPLPADTIRNSGYMAAKLYAGVNKRAGRSVFGASYGVEAGFTGAANDVSWIKHVADVSHDVGIRIGDHRQLDIESRLTAGYIDVRDSIPVTARFFGGNREQNFIPGDAWNIRSNPVIRSIAANRYGSTNAGVGGTRFIAYNFTASFPIWRRPFVPSELSNSADFGPLVLSQVDNATSVLQTEFAARDPHFLAVFERIPEVREVLQRLSAAVAQEQSRHTGKTRELLNECADAVRRAESRARAAVEARGDRLGRVNTLLSVSTEDRLNKVQQACFDDLKGEVQNAAIVAEATELRRIHADMEREYSMIDEAAATRKAEGEMMSVRQTLNTLLYDLNVASVGPVFIFDVAHLGPAAPGGARFGTRYGIGAGVRASVVNTVDLTMAYVANPRRARGESKGAFFLTLRIKEFF